MRVKNKKVVIVVTSIVIFLLLLVTILIVKNVNEEETKQEENIELSEVINIEDIENLSYETKETEEEISSKYIAVRNKYEVNAQIMLGEITGKMIFVRGANNINVYKVEYTLDKYGDKNSQTSGIIKGFEESCINYIGIDETYEETEELYGESNAEFEIPIEESIYNEGRLYSKIYKNEENEYNINFYRKENKIICEFVKVL